MSSVFGRVPEPRTCVGPDIAGLARADTGAKGKLLAVLGHAGGDEALEVIRNELASDNDDAKTAAVRALGNWPDAPPAGD